MKIEDWLGIGDFHLQLLFLILTKKQKVASFQIIKLLTSFLVVFLCNIVAQKWVSQIFLNFKIIFQQISLMFRFQKICIYKFCHCVQIYCLYLFCINILPWLVYNFGKLHKTNICLLKFLIIIFEKKKNIEKKTI